MAMDMTLMVAGVHPGKPVWLEIKADDSIASIKSRIEVGHGLDAAYQNLRLGPHHLEDHRTVGSYNTSGSHVLLFVLTLRGGYHQARLNKRRNECLADIRECEEFLALHRSAAKKESPVRKKIKTWFQGVHSFEIESVQFNLTFENGHRRVCLSHSFRSRTSSSKYWCWYSAKLFVLFC